VDGSGPARIGGGWLYVVTNQTGTAASQGSDPETARKEAGTSNRYCGGANDTQLYALKPVLF
tara:strand:- start:359 stop:544 length:186 start_codon:yes stop_codon:yes gene_type:complete